MYVEILFLLKNMYSESFLEDKNGDDFVDFCREKLEILRFSKKDIKSITNFARFFNIDILEIEALHILHDFGDCGIESLVVLNRKVFDRWDDERLDLLESGLKMAIELKMAYSLKNLAINGNDIKEVLNIKDGRRIAEILNILLDSVIGGDVENKKVYLLELAIKIANAKKYI